MPRSSASLPSPALKLVQTGTTGGAFRLRFALDVDEPRPALGLDHCAEFRLSLTDRHLDRCGLALRLGSSRAQLLDLDRLRLRFRTPTDRGRHLLAVALLGIDDRTLRRLDRRALLVDLCAQLEHCCARRLDRLRPVRRRDRRPVDALARRHSRPAACLMSADMSWRGGLTVT